MNEKKLLRGVLIFVGTLLLISFLFPHEPKLRSWDQFTFSTTSDSRLYFQNMRSYWYVRSEKSDQGIHIHRYKKWDDDAPFSIRPMLVEQWKIDEAMVFLEVTDTSSSEYGDGLILGTDTIKMDVHHMNREAYAEIAHRWYSHIDTAHAYSVLSNQGNIYQPSKREYEAARTVLSDYFTLVGFLR